MRKGDIPWYVLLLGSVAFTILSVLYCMMYVPFPLVLLPVTVHVIMLIFMIVVIIVPVTLDPIGDAD